MGFAKTVGKYRLGSIIGVGTFAKVRLAEDTTNGHRVAIKVIDKHMVMARELKYQVQREIQTMKLLQHPNIVRIHEVIGTKKNIYIVMEYVSGGQLSDKLVYAKKLNETEARRLFQQLIDAVDHCHNKGVFHRDLKPENLLLSGKGNLKVSDFGLSALRKPASMLSTACGSPCYVAPELLANRGYEGAAADVWSCGVILFELLAGYLPFDDHNLVVLYHKISRAEYTFPEWFTRSQMNIISRILDPNPKTRLTIPEIIQDAWFQTDYVPSSGIEHDHKICCDDVNAAFDAIVENDYETKMLKSSSSFINAFKLIATSQDLDLSGLFEEQGGKQTTKLGSKHTVEETLRKLETAAAETSLSVQRRNNYKPHQILTTPWYQIIVHTKQKMTRWAKTHCELSVEIIEVAPTNCVVEISKAAGELPVYRQFCEVLSDLLNHKSDESSQIQESEKEASSFTEKFHETRRYSI